MVILYAIDISNPAHTYSDLPDHHIFKSKGLLQPMHHPSNFPISWIDFIIKGYISRYVCISHINIWVSLAAKGSNQPIQNQARTQANKNDTLTEELFPNIH